MVDVAEELNVAVDDVCRLIVKARQYFAKEGVVEEDYGGNPVDEGFRENLADQGDDPVLMELIAFIDGLNVDARCDLVALMWVGRGDFAPEEWPSAVELAQEENRDNTSEYLLGIPVLADHLQAGLEAFDLSCDDFEKQHL
jgi:hypothetical protein